MYSNLINKQSKQNNESEILSKKLDRRVEQIKDLTNELGVTRSQVGIFSMILGC
jgi:hypothetical protein